MREIRTRNARPGSNSLEGRDRPTGVRQRLEGSLETVGGTFQDGDERISAESAGSQVAADHGRAAHQLFFWRRRQIAGQLRSPQALENSTFFRVVRLQRDAKSRPVRGRTALK